MSNKESLFMSNVDNQDLESAGGPHLKIKKVWGTNMRRWHVGGVCVAIVLTVITAVSIAAPKAFSQQAASQDECDQWVKSHADQSMQMKMEEDGERSMFMLTPPGDPLPVVCLVRYDPFKPPRYQGIGTATRAVPGGPEVQAS